MANPTPRHFDTILSPIITEKATLLSEHNKVVFKVAMDSTKDEISAAIESLFKVNVTKVNTMIVKPRWKTFRGKSAGKPGFTRSKKKAIVRLTKESKQIELI